MNRKHAHALLVGLLATPLVGCGGPFDARVKGQVSLDGQPLTVGTVTFAPASSGPSAFAKIDDSGNYELSVGRQRGLPSGQYTVTVVAREKTTVQRTDGGPPPPGKLITPPWYKSTNDSGLSFTVEPGSNSIDLDLNTTPPANWRGGRPGRR
ncbi:MAG: carboxypeptidase-like regulatory domain-containing protein [Planctomycetota bacterium]